MKKSKKEKLRIFLITLAIIIVITTIGFLKTRKKYVNTTSSIESSYDYIELGDDGRLINTSEYLLKPQKLDDISINQISLKELNDSVEMTAFVKNNGEKNLGDTDITFLMKERNENELGNITFHVKLIEPGIQQKVVVNIDKKYIKTYNYKIVINEL